MPIRPEERARYPKDWRAITARVRERAEDCCECRGECGTQHGLRERKVRGRRVIDTYTDRCGVPNHELIERDPARLEKWRVHEHTGDCLGESCDAVKVVLTVAHLNHTPEDCSMANLLAMCQLCHNRMDAKHRAESKLARKRAAAASGDLFA